MPHDRYFIDAPLELDLKIWLEEEEFHHLHVMRKSKGDIVEVINGKNVLSHARIDIIEKKRALLYVIDVKTFTRNFPLILAQAVPRINRLDDIIEKGTELGVSAFWLFPGEKSEKKEIKERELLRFQRIAISAMKQCGRYDLPSIEIKSSLDSWQKLPFPAFFGDLSLNAPLFKEVWKKEKGAIFFVGPESGFHEKEIFLLKNLQVQGVRLHPYVLRTETASLCALTLIQHGRL